MRLSKRSYLILACLSLVLVGTGCQKAAPKGVRGKAGATGAGAQTTAQDQSDKKVDQLIKDGKNVADCTPVILSRNEELKNLMAKAKEFLASKNDGSELEDEDIDSLTKSSSDINKAYQVLASEISKQLVSSCGTKDKKVSLEQARSQTLASVVAIADRLGKDTPESTAARATLKRLADVKTTDVLDGMTLKISKTLSDSLDEQSQKNILFVANGNIGQSQAAYDQALRFTTTICLFTQAPTKKLEENADVKVVKTEVLSASQAEQPDQKQNATSNVYKLAVHLTSADQVLSFECRLASDLKKDSAASQFLAAFQGLLQK